VALIDPEMDWHTGNSKVLKSLNKAFGTRVAVAEETAAVVEPFFVLRLLMRVAVVGKVRVQRLYEVVALRDDRSADAINRIREADSLGSVSSDHASVISTATGTTFKVAFGERDLHWTPALLDAAASLDDVVLSDAKRLQEIASFTGAVQALIRLDFSSCLSTLDALPETRCPTGCVMLLRALCEDGLSGRPCDGTWYASEK